MKLEVSKNLHLPKSKYLLCSMCLYFYKYEYFQFIFVPTWVITIIAQGGENLWQIESKAKQIGRILFTFNYIFICVHSNVLFVAIMQISNIYIHTIVNTLYLYIERMCLCILI